MVILVTNDDGFDALGIRILAQALAGQAEIFLAAPDRERSASGHGITVDKPLRVREIKEFQGLSKGWAIDGTPADCVKLAVDALLDTPIDFLISGINKGANLGNDILYSGTVSAAAEAVMLGIPAMAVSLISENDSLQGFNTAAQMTKELLKLIMKNKLPPDILMNVNVPDVSAAEIRGFSVCHLGKRRYTNAIHRREDPRGIPYYWVAGDVEDLICDEGTDICAVKNKQVAVTPIKLDLTCYNTIEAMKKWNFNGRSD